LKPKCSPQQVSNPRPEDNDFAQRLYADLQAKNVRCWKFDEWDHPRKADVVSKVIGDFRGSDNLATYSRAFPRFLDALNRPQ
jgi:hypothetical protein